MTRRVKTGILYRNITGGRMNKYEQFFYKSRRSSSKTGKSVQILKPERAVEFLEKLSADNESCERIRLLVGLLFCGGLRISEAIGIKRDDIEKRGDFWIIKINVKKKKFQNASSTREIIVHPLLDDLLCKVIHGKRPNEYILNKRAKKGIKGETLTRQKGLHRIKSMFETDAHSFRHSNVSFLLWRDYKEIKIAKTLDMSIKNVSNYAHIDQVGSLKTAFGL